jgi:hypothetical protein
MHGLYPEPNVSSFGDNLDKAKQSLVEAVEALLEECLSIRKREGNGKNYDLVHAHCLHILLLRTIKTKK